MYYIDPSAFTGRPEMPRYCKKDFHSFTITNQECRIYQRDDGTMYLIDWVHASQGNASADVARTYTTLYLNNKEAAEKYYSDFCSKTNTDKSYVHKWLPIIAAANLTKKRPEEKDILEKWLNVADLM
jgi:hypothetical protein